MYEGAGFPLAWQWKYTDRPFSTPWLTGNNIMTGGSEIYAKIYIIQGLHSHLLNPHTPYIVFNVQNLLYWRYHSSGNIFQASYLCSLTYMPIKDSCTNTNQATMYTYSSQKTLFFKMNRIRKRNIAYATLWVILKGWT